LGVILNLVPISAATGSTRDERVGSVCAATMGIRGFFMTLTTFPVRVHVLCECMCQRRDGGYTYMDTLAH
jgi:hypothetical protein